MANFKKYRTVTITDENSSTGVDYVGVARIPAGMTLLTAKGLDIWQIKKYVKTGTENVITDMLLPYDATAGYSEDMIFVRDNRASLTWDTIS